MMRVSGVRGRRAEGGRLVGRQRRLEDVEVEVEWRVCVAEKGERSGRLLHSEVIEVDVTNS